MVGVVYTDGFRLGFGTLRIGVGLTDSRLEREEADDGCKKATAKYKVEDIAELHDVVYLLID